MDTLYSLLSTVLLTKDVPEGLGIWALDLLPHQMVVEEDSVEALLEALLLPDHGLDLAQGGVQGAVPELVIGI